MSNFKTWLRRKEQKIAETLDDGSGYRYNSEEDRAGDYEVALNDLTKIVMSKYNNEFMKFLNQLVRERGDNELERMLKKVDPQKNAGHLYKPRKNKEQEDVVAPISDRGHEENGGS